MRRPRLPYRLAVCAVAVAGVFAIAAEAVPPPARRTIVACAPGYPGSTEQAQPNMDTFAAGVARSARIPVGRVGAVYHETAEAGLERMKQPDAAFALVPLPFFLEHGEPAGLEPRLLAVPKTGGEEVWSLVAPRGKVASPAGLAGWEILSRAGYSPAFVRAALTDGWGELPASVRIAFSNRILTALRRAAGGESVAVLLDNEQTGALASLGFAAELETLFASKPLPGSLLCSIRGRMEAGERDDLLEAMLKLHASRKGEEALGAIRLVRFEALDAARLEDVQARWKKSAPPDR